MAFQFPANPTLGLQYAPAQGVTYEWNGTGWILLGMTVASLYPAGIIMPYAGGAPLPFQGWLLCDGASYATTAQPALFAIIGYSYGGSSGNFSVPDLRGRVVAGVDGGAGRLSSATLGAGLGAERIALATSELPAHAHGITDVAHSHGVSDPTHAHGVYDPGHTHNNNVNDPGHSHGVYDPGHEHGYDRSYAQGNEKPAGQGTPAPHDAYQQNPIARTNGAGTGIGINSSGTGVSVNIHGAGTAIGIYGAGTGIGIYNSGTGISGTHNTGSNGGHLNVQPTMCLNYIIKA